MSKFEHEIFFLKKKLSADTCHMLSMRVAESTWIIIARPFSSLKITLEFCPNVKFGQYMTHKNHPCKTKSLVL